MIFCDVSVPLGTRWHARSAFTLVELLVVMGVITVLLGLMLPALTSVKGGQDITADAYSLAGELETARNFAISNHTYTWVGFYEQDYNSASAPAAPSQPPYAGVGHLTVGIVYSKDGTNLSDLTQISTTQASARVGQVDKIVNIYGVHLTALNSPSNPNSTDPSAASTLQGRPYQTDLDSTTLRQTLISSDTADQAAQQLVAQGYTFYKTIRFNSRGESSIDGAMPCTRIIELGLQPTHGDTKNAAATNTVAIQQAGIAGSVSIYRQ